MSRPQALSQSLLRSITKSGPRRQPSRKRHVRTRVVELWPLARYQYTSQGLEVFSLLFSTSTRVRGIPPYLVFNTASSRQQGQYFIRVFYLPSFPYFAHAKAEHTHLSSLGSLVDRDRDRLSKRSTLLLTSNFFLSLSDHNHATA
jgi:hypothetical protein